MLVCHGEGYKYTFSRTLRHLPTFRSWPKHVAAISLYISNSAISRSWPGSSVGIAADYGMDGPGSNPSGDKIFPPAQTGPRAHPASSKMGTGSFLGVKRGRGVLLTTHALLVPRSWKCRAIPLPTLWATPGL